MLNGFAVHYGRRSVADINRADLLAHMVRLQSKGLGPRTIFNHTARINTLLKANGVMQVLRPADWPKFDEKVVSAYHAEQLTALFTAASADERMLFQFFLATGFREQEVMHCTWSNVDFRDCVISVRSKPEFGFRPKDKEERAVPVPDSLIEALTSRKRTSSSALLFPGRGGRPDGHFLRRLQKLAFRAELNCGECTTRGGQSCLTRPVCRRWGLHEFRRTFATSHSESSVPPSTIQRWLGHSDLTTTLRYLAVADLRSGRTRSQVNASFSFMTLGTAA
jgi:integrase/recombinase XerD